LPGLIPGNLPVISIAVFVIFFGIKNWLGFVISRAQYKFIGKIAVRVSETSLFKFQQARFNEFINTDSSVHIRQIAFQPFEFSQYILSGIQQIITQLSLVIVAIVAILLYDTKIFLLLLVILLPPVILVSYFIKQRLTAAKKHIQENNQKSFQYLLDALKGYVESNIYDRNDFFLERFINARQKFSKHLFDSLALQSMPARIIEIFAVLGLFILIVIAKWTGNNDHETLITIGAFMAAAYKIIPGIVKIINISGQMKAYEFPLINPGEFKQTNKVATLTKTIQDIQSVEFRLVGITGESGKGKTTIFNIVLGFLTVSKGEVIINGVTVSSPEIKNYWPYFSYVRQQKFFIHDTLLKNISLAEQEYNKDDLQYALYNSGLEKAISIFPEGLEKLITENGKNISGGQQQRIAIARALYKNASFVLLDEPFNELDEEATRLLLEHFRELALTGKAVIMITHDKKSLSYCNKIISLDQ
jgi:ABC-type transport system involved in cytochrome bd biosynthesis fused ATPase/permease subunit